MQQVTRADNSGLSKRWALSLLISLRVWALAAAWSVGSAGIIQSASLGNSGFLERGFCWYHSVGECGQQWLTGAVVAVDIFEPASVGNSG